MENKELKEFKEILHEVKDTETAQENNDFAALFFAPCGFWCGFCEPRKYAAQLFKPACCRPSSLSAHCGRYRQRP